MVAVRVDHLTGVEERLEHVVTPRGRLYTWTARPPSATSCVVVCCSVLADFTANYHRERTFGHLLAARGHGVIRFHYAGEGNSQGERSELTLASMRDDANAVLDHASSRGFTRFGLLGTRIGGLVAAATVAALPASAPLALWEPVHDPQRFLTEARRADRISRTTQGAQGNGEGWRQELERSGMLNLIGYDVYPPMVHSLEVADLVSELGHRVRPVFLARFRDRVEANRPISERMFAAGFPVEVRTYGVSESWWFHDQQAPDSGDLVTDTVDWFNGLLGEEA